jgi:hypothetical protein
VPEPAKLIDSYRLGMKRDFARDKMPDGSFWNMIDLLPEVIDGRARKRGGYERASQAVSAVTGTATKVAAGIFAPYSDGDSNLFFDEDGRAYEVESLTGTENIGAAIATRSPVFYSNMVIVPDAAGSAGPQKITRSSGAHSVTALDGTPPAGRYAVIYKDVLWLASPAASADRIFFSVAGNPESWDTTNRWLDVSFPITGLVALQNAVFVFGLSRTARIRGSIPPPDTDFIVDDPIFDIGCTDNRSIALYREKVIWGNANGLFISDGTAMEDLTRLCGMKSWWLDIMDGSQGFSTGTEYSISGFSIVTQVYGDYLVYSVLNGTTLVDSGIIDLVRYSWMRFSNIDMSSAWRRPYPEEVFWGNTHVNKTSSFFDPTAGTKADADGDSVLPQLETPFFMDNSLLKTIRRVFLTYDIRDAASDNPALTISHINSPEETSYDAIASTLPETSEVTRVHRSINRPMRGIAFKIAQTGASSDTRLYDLELEAQEREGFR